MSLPEILQILLSNAAVALVLAVLAVLATGLRARPALVHALWVLVLLKLVTPPIVHVPIALPEAPVQTTASVATPLWVPPAQTSTPIAPIPPTATPASTPRPATPEASPQIPWLPILLGLWALGSALTLFSTGRDLRRMRGLIRRARPAPPKLQQQVNQLARRMGMRAAPTVSLIPARLSPMLWAAFGAPRLLLPEGLLRRLDHGARTSLLVHELAHMRRKDHWVRYLEVVVRTAYWWNPLVWWACHQLRIAEEECCDGWVLWALPRASRNYADALLETVEFLNGSPTALPAAASGVGRAQNLKRRLTMIMQGNTRRSLTRRGRLAVLSVAALALPLIPVHGQEREQLHLEQALHEHHSRLQDLHQELEELKVHAEHLHQSGDQSQLHEIQDRIHEVHARVANEEDVLATLQDNLHAVMQEGLHPRHQQDREQDRAHQHPDQEVMLDALHTAIDLLRSEELFDKAELLADLADNIGRESQQSDNQTRHLVELERALADERDRRTALEMAQIDVEGERHALEMEMRMAEELRQREIQADRHAIEMEQRVAQERHEVEQHARQMELHMAEQRAQLERDAEVHMIEMQRRQAEAETEARAREVELDQLLLERQASQGGHNQDQMHRLEARVEELAEMVKKLTEITEKQQAKNSGRSIRR